MTWQVALYFLSILLTAGSAVFLARHAWRQRPLAGAGAFTILSLGVGLLSLTELLVLTSPTRAQALVWFNLRYLFIAPIPALFVIFALSYTRRKAWLSANLTIGLFIVPFITQVMVWSNSLHSLWVLQETGLQQNGIFWTIETGARLPGLWFMVHTIYSLLLILVGIMIILVTAWSKRRFNLGQGLLLSLGSLLALMSAILPVFKLLPPTAFNIFIPGTGACAICYALAFFRFDFMKRAPMMDAALSITGMDAQTKRSLALFGLAFLLLVSGFGGASYFSYNNYQRHSRAQIESELFAVAELKVNGLQNWRAERLADASLFYQNENFTIRVKQFFETPQDSEARARLLTWLEKIQANPEYRRIALLDTRGDVRLSLPTGFEALPTHLPDQAAACLELGEVVFLDFHRHPEDNAIYLALLIPIYDQTDDGSPLGVLILQIDPEVYLYPFIQRWPAPSASAETLLVRQDGEEVLYLNQLRFAADAALTLRLPLQRVELPAVQAVLGAEGIQEGWDYRGIPVIAEVRPVPGSPWFIITKIDTAEVFAPLNERLAEMLILFTALTVASGAGLMLAWRQQRLRAYQAQVRTLQALHTSEEKFRKAFLISPDSVVITRQADGRFVSVNQGFTQILGYAEDEIIGKTSLDCDIWVDPQDRQKIVAALQENGVAVNYEAQFRTKRGEIIYGLMSAAIIELNGEAHILNTTRDITERKRMEQAIYLMSDTQRQIAHLDQIEAIYCLVGEKVRELIGSGYTVVSILDESIYGMRIAGMYGFGALYQTLVDKFRLDPSRMIYYLEEMTAEELRAFRSGRLEKLEGGLYALMTRKVPRPICTAIEKQLKLDAIYTMGFVWNEFHYGGLTILAQHAIAAYTRMVETIMNQAAIAIKRIRSESALRESEERFKTLLNRVSNIAVQGYQADGTVHYWNKASEKIYGYTSDEALGKNLTDLIIPPEMRPAVTQAVRQMVATGEALPAEELWLRHKDGSLVPVYSNHTVIEVSGREKELYCIDIDLSERKQAEEKVRLRSEELAILNSVGRAINASLNLKHASSTGMKGILNAVHPDVAFLFLREEDKLRLKETLPEGAAAGFGSIPDHRVGECMCGLAASQNQPQYALDIFTDSRCTWLECKQIGLKSFAALPLRSGDEVIGVIGLASMTERDFSKQSEFLETLASQVSVAVVNAQLYEAIQNHAADLEQRVQERTRDLQEAQEKLLRQEKLAFLGQLAGSVGHELRNPLGVVANAVYYLKMAQPGADDRVKEYLNIIESEVRRSDKIISDLLDFNRIKSVERDTASVQDLVRQTLLHYPPQPTVTVIQEIPEDLPPVYVDPRQIMQVLGNLLVNACQAMPQGGVITIAAAAQRDMIVITVQDTGEGIPPENMEKLFEPLFTTKARGIGLGLAVSKKLVETNGGRIEAESQLGQGSTFRMALPIKT